MTGEHELARAAQAIRAAASAMLSDPHFESTFEEWPSVIAEDIDAWEEWAQSQSGMSNYRVPTSLRALYLTTGGFRWTWRYLRDEPQRVVSGSAEIVSLIALYQRDEEAGNPLATIYRAPRPFDVISDREEIRLRFTPDAGDRPLLIHERAGEPDKSLRISIDQYLPMLARYRAVYGWQSIFHESPARDDKKARIDATVRRLFP